MAKRKAKSRVKSVKDIKEQLARIERLYRHNDTFVNLNSPSDLGRMMQANKAAKTHLGIRLTKGSIHSAHI